MDDSKEKILKDWNELKLGLPIFRKFKDFRRFIYINASQQGNKKRVDTQKRLFFKNEKLSRKTESKVRIINTTINIFLRRIRKFSANKTLDHNS